jgi:hypothetical protein
MFREILNNAIRKAGNQENLAAKLDISPTALTNKINGKTSWHESEIDIVFKIADFCTACRASHQKETEALSETIRIVLEGKKRIQDELRPVFKKGSRE